MMNLPTSIRRVAFATWLLATPCLGTAPAGRDPLRDDPPAREAIEAGLEKRRAALLKLEASVQSLRDEVKLQLTDVVAGQQVAVVKAQQEFRDAKRARSEAGFAVQEYVQGVYLQDHAMAEGKVALAKADLRRATDAVNAIKARLDEGNKVDPLKITRAQLELQQAEFDEEQAKTELEILVSYTKDKVTKKLQAAEAAAESVEAEKGEILRLEQAKAARLGEQAGRYKVRSPEDVVVALLDDAIQDEGKVVALVADSRKIEAQIRENPGEAATLTENLRAKKSEAETLMNRAKSQILDATILAEQVKALRVKLRDAEAQLKNQRKLLDEMERVFAPGR